MAKRCARHETQSIKMAWSVASSKDTTEGALGVRALHLHRCSVGASWRNGSNGAMSAWKRAGIAE